MGQEPTFEDVERWTYHRIGERLDQMDERLARLEAAIERLAAPSPALIELKEVASLGVVAVQLVQAFGALRETVQSLRETTHAEHADTRRAVSLQLSAADLARERGRA